MEAKGVREMRLRDLATDNEAKIVEMRRALHAIPELSHREEQTSKTLSEALSALGLTVRRIPDSTGIIADLSSNDGSQTVALRADMDGLPVAEANKIPFKSRHAGRMHACGHDGHMAIVYGAALLFSKLHRDIRGNVRFIFQPAEEEATVGGAREIIAAGGLDGVKGIMGLHIWPELDEGVIGYRKGPFFAALNRFVIRISGRKFHTARPDLTTDALTTGLQIVQGINNTLNRRSYPWTPFTLTVHTFKAEGRTATVTGIISSTAPDRSRLSIQPGLDLRGVRRALTELVRSTCDYCGTKGAVEIMDGYPPLITDSGVTEIAVSAARKVVGEERVVRAYGTLGGEDFSRYLEKVPGSYVLLGAFNEKLRYTHMLHTPRFNFNEAILTLGSAFMAQAAVEMLRWSPGAEDSHRASK